LIEWPEKGGPFTPVPDVQIQLFHQAEARLLDLRALSEMGQAILAEFKPPFK